MNQLYKLVRYNTINATLYWLNARTNVLFTVSLNKSTKDNSVKYCYNEYGNRNGINAYVDLEWSIKLRDIKSYMDGGTFRVTKMNMYQFVNTIRTMRIWFTDPKHSDVFLVDKTNKLYRCNAAYKPLITVNQFNEKLEIVSAVMVTDTGDHIPGAQLFIHTAPEPVFLKIQDYLNFEMFISSINPTMLAMQLLTMFNAGSIDEDPRDKRNDISLQNKRSNESFLSMAGATRRDDS